jgi:hypothetical protein
LPNFGRLLSSVRSYIALKNCLVGEPRGHKGVPSVCKATAMEIEKELLNEAVAY